MAQDKTIEDLDVEGEMTVGGRRSELHAEKLDSVETTTDSNVSLNFGRDVKPGEIITVYWEYNSNSNDNLLLRANGDGAGTGNYFEADRAGNESDNIDQVTILNVSSMSGAQASGKFIIGTQGQYLGFRFESIPRVGRSTPEADWGSYKPSTSDQIDFIQQGSGMNVFRAVAYSNILVKEET